jgi:hypothetical protein
MFVVYHKETTLRLDKLSRGTNKTMFPTVAGARGALTRACNKDVTLIKEAFGIIDACYFYSDIEKKETVHNLMSGKPVVQGVNTPLCCDPSSETYWSM